MRIGLVAGEASGDVLGADLITALRRRFPEAQFEGIAGPRMVAAGCRPIFSSERLAVMGLFEVLGRLPELLSIRRSIKRYFISNKPDVFIGIDAPDFNLGLERSLRENQIPTVHYVSPSVWAWRQKRVKFVSRCVDLLLTLLPFEAAFYRDHGVPVQFVGHTLADQIPLAMPDVHAARQQLGVDSGVAVVAVLPGSRLSEVTRLGPVFIETMLWLRERMPTVEFVVPFATPRVREKMQQLLKLFGAGLSVHGLDGQARLAMQAADVVLVASGTATLEAMLMKRPMVMAYKLNQLTYNVVKWFNLVKIRTFSLPNLLAGETLVPEFIQEAATPSAMGQALMRQLADVPHREYLIQRFANLHQALQQNASECAADAIAKLISKRE